MEHFTTLPSGLDPLIPLPPVSEVQVQIHSLDNIASAAPVRILMNDIQKIVASYYNMNVDTMTSDKRTRAIAHPRQVAMFLCREFTDRSFPEIGRRFGGRDHTTVLHADRVVKQRIGEDKDHGMVDFDPVMAEDVRVLRQALRQLQSPAPRPLPPTEAHDELVP